MWIGWAFFVPIAFLAIGAQIMVIVFWLRRVERSVTNLSDLVCLQSKAIEGMSQNILSIAQKG